MQNSYFQSLFAIETVPTETESKGLKFKLCKLSVNIFYKILNYYKNLCSRIFHFDIVLAPKELQKNLPRKAELAWQFKGGFFSERADAFIISPNKQTQLFS